MIVHNLFILALSVTVTSCVASSSSLIFEATKAGDLAQVKRLVSQGAEIDIVHAHTPLHEAVIKGHTKLVAYFLKKGANPSGNKTNQTPLHSAARYDRLEEVRLLVAYGAHIESFNNAGQMPIHRAAEFGSLQVLDYFLNTLKISPDIRTLHGQTALHYAVSSGHIACVQFLLKNKAPVDSQERFGWLRDVFILRATSGCSVWGIGWGRTPLHLACMSGHLDIAKLLIEHGASVHKLAHMEKSALFFACCNNHVPIIELLLSLGVDPNKESVGEGTPLFIASEKGFTQAVRLLLKAGARVDLETNYNSVPLIAACQQGHREIVELLLEQSLDAEKAKALFSACISGKAEILDVLLSHKVDPNIVFGVMNNETPLSMACRQGNLNLAQVLLSHGADPNFFSRKGEPTPLSIACAQGNIDLVELLVHHGADIRIPGPLHAACSYGHLKTVQFLVARGADIDAKDCKGRTSLEKACNPLRWKEEVGYPRIVEYLLSLGAAKEQPFSNWNLIERNGNTEIAALLLAYGHSKDGRLYLSYMCKRGHLSIVQLFVQKGLIPQGFKIEDTFPGPIKEYLAEALYPSPIEQNDYRYKLRKEKSTIGSSFVGACSSIVSSRPMQIKYKTD